MLTFFCDLDNMSHAMDQLEPQTQLLPQGGWLEVGQLSPGPVLPLPSEERTLRVGASASQSGALGHKLFSFDSEELVQGWKNQLEALTETCLPLQTRKCSWGRAGQQEGVSTLQQGRQEVLLWPHVLHTPEVYRQASSCPGLSQHLSPLEQPYFHLIIGSVLSTARATLE